MKWFFDPCRRYEGDLSLLAAGALADPERSEVKAHLERCAACRARFTELKTIADQLSRDGRTVPVAEPPATLRRRWIGEVRHATRTERRLAAPTPVPFWGGRWAWGSVAAIWALILFFRYSTPQTSRPAVAAASPPSLRQVLLVLRSGPRDLPVSGQTEPQPEKDPAPPGAANPHRDGSQLRPAENPKVI